MLSPYSSFQLGALREDAKRPVRSTWLVTLCVLLLWVTCYSVGDLSRRDFRVLCDYHLCHVRQSARVIITIYICKNLDR